MFRQKSDGRHTFEQFGENTFEQLAQLGKVEFKNQAIDIPAQTGATQETLPK